MMLRSASIPLRRAASSWQKPFACRSIGTFFSSTPPSAPTSTPPKDFLSKVEIVEEIAETYDISKAKAAKILNTTLDSIVEAVADGRSVRLTGFGTFESYESKATTKHNPITREKIQIPVRQRIRFKPHRAFKGVVDPTIM